MITVRLGCRQPSPQKLASHPDVRFHPTVSKSMISVHETIVAENARRSQEVLDRLSGRTMALGLPVENQLIVSTRSMLPRDANELPAAPRVDQGQSGSCTWGSSSVAAWVACKSIGTPLDFIPSQRAGYSLTLALERKAAGHTPAVPLADVGADLEDVFVVWRDWGVEPMEVPLTPDGRFYDIWTPGDGALGLGNVTDEPNLDEVMRAQGTRLLVDLGPHTIHPEDWSAPELMAMALSGAGGQPPLPVMAAGFVDSAFCSNGDPAEVLGPCNPFDKDGGGHAFWFSAYRTNAQGVYEFKLENSWGSSWRADGAVWVAESFVRRCWALYVPNITIKRG